MKTIASFITVIFLSIVFMSASGTRVITGTVLDENGYALIGVSVKEKGSANGATTDVFGKYSLNISPKAKTLVFSFTGMETEYVSIGSSNRIDIQMKNQLLEVEIEEVGPCYVMDDQALIGTVAGVKVRPFIGSRNEKKSMTGSISYASMNYSPQQEDWNTEGYAAIHENGFKDVMHNPLSTFSIDVDKASYSNVRRFINMGQKPPVDAVRIEEMINYFTYDYPQPDGEHPFTVTTEYSVCPWNSEQQMLQIGLQGQNIEKENLPPSNIVFLVDVSGSMSAHNKLPLLKSAFRLLVNELRPEDRVAIVVYAGAAGVVLESTPGNEKSTILSSLNNLQAGGSTAGGAGIKLAYKIAEQNFIEEGNNRIILATDGDFNIGQSSDAEMERLIESKREKGVFITALGFGMGNYKDSKMETIADKGNGNYSYIDNIQEANKVLVSEFGGTLFAIAKDVKFQIEFNPQRVKGYRLVGYENRLLNDEDFNDDTKDAGEMGAGHTVTALYEIIPAGADKNVADIDPLKYQTQKQASEYKGTGELMTVKLRYKKPDGNKSMLYELPVQGEEKKFEKTSDNFRFAVAVAQYGMILRDSKYLEEGSIEDVLEMARNARGADSEGYRGEFIKIVTTSSSVLASMD
ncbi:MAG: von Willebrand factor type A domain-containing protein [Bacteroidales bacterium]|nr:von Willebrand factor type A domain-containing protein [Bacteroidales bacterium]